ncbi:hypothetical protein Poli38472_002682 [Pythium oligandrum]|uniref:TLDc domain-containing protein n=1 Tax=Pythium oligandrum TaxID=41045 RepID=A0A8K1CHM8_PYTOL|nr:hypothetical protein Poli38472_002682 [Pythium oligandrum]|eukprot:TMW63741.1 hypothetical protein Poli38472_002682 [Pythium oligandrum]
MAFSFSGLLNSLFDFDDVEEELRTNQASPSNRATSPSSPISVPYTPSQFDGEYNVWFTKKPLGLGLVPSTQLYGTWEVSTIAPASPRRRAVSGSQSTSPVSSSLYDQEVERAKITRGDVIIAVNYSTKKAQLPRNEFAQYLQRSSLPVVVTLRKPEVYGSFDSRSLSTAMFPASVEYRNRSPEKSSFFARASSVQWRRSLQHELSKASSSQKESIETTATSQKSPQPPSQQEQADHKEAHPGSTFERRQSIEMSPMGEFTFTFYESPLHLLLAPSTRLYASVEIYDPKIHAPLIQIGDVIMAVNDDSSVSRWPTDELIDHIAGLEPPVTIRFRRPTVYRQYLEVYFKTTKKPSSSKSLAKSMFPDSAEYKRNTRHHASNQPRSEKSRRESSDAGSPRSSRQLHHAKLSKEDWRQASMKFESSDQFKLWKSVGSASKASSHTSSAFLTERHVQFLWKHLPVYLTCNEMELAYDTRRHGWNLLSFYGLLEDKGPTILAIKDSRDQIFGVFSPASWKHSTDVYGNGRCFVFTLRPHMRVYEWSGLENTFLYGRRNAFFVGGGKKGIALCVELDDLRGFSQACETFDSPPLAHGESFEIENLEVWCFAGLRI